MPPSDEPDPLDQLAVVRAEIDQLQALAPEGARVARAWYDAYRNQNFTDRQALYLAAAQVLQNPGVPPA
jgi:hypothetical protein